jgi:uncharacterized protein (TIGR01244 family)
MTDFRQLSAQVWASPQISPSEVKEAAARGFAAIVNNRPDGEADGQPTGAEIEAAAHAAGLAYHAIPITHAGFSEAQALAMAELLASAAGPILAFCRSGTRSTLLWALARASAGDEPAALGEAAAAAGYDLAPISPALDALAARAAGG